MFKRMGIMALLAAGVWASALTVTVNQGSTQVDPANSLPVVFDVVFSAAVEDFAIGDVTWSGTATGITAEIAGSGTTYTISVTVSGDGTLIPSLAAEVAQDGSANLNEASTSTDNSVTYDSTDPTVTIEQGSEQDDPAVSLPVTFDITFDEPVTGFATGDITMGGTATSPVYAVTGSGAAYTLTVSDATLGGTLIPSIDASKCTDLAGNDNEASDSTDNTVSCMTLAGFLELFAAIQAKTDNLPSSPAAVGSEMLLTAAYDAAKTAAQEGDAMTLTAAYDASKTAATQTSVDTIDATADAIKVKTDNLPASPAAVGSAMTLTSAYDAAKTAATQTSVDILADPVAVNQHYGATAANPYPLAARRGGIGVSGVTITAYLKSDYDAGGRTVKGQTTTNVSGFWTTTMSLMRGAYTLVYSGTDFSKTVEVTVE